MNEHMLYSDELASIVSDCGAILDVVAPDAIYITIPIEIAAKGAEAVYGCIDLISRLIRHQFGRKFPLKIRIESRKASTDSAYKKDLSAFVASAAKDLFAIGVKHGKHPHIICKDFISLFRQSSTYAIMSILIKNINNSLQKEE